VSKKKLFISFFIALIFILTSPIDHAYAAATTDKQQEFIDSIKAEAINSYNQNNILPSLTIAQAILESSWGESTLASKGNNLFGVKAYSDWSGSSISLSTKEFVKGRYIRVKAKFKAYPTVNQSIKDHCTLLSSSRYLNVRKAKNYKEACNAIYKCGYATSPSYTKSLIKIIESFELYKYDVKQSLSRGGNTPNTQDVSNPKEIKSILLPPKDNLVYKFFNQQ
jgi:flagellum-specific peptidoglycan hydrolase FlgJ